MMWRIDVYTTAQGQWNLNLIDKNYYALMSYQI
jgi:hypothetical protein